MSSSLHSDLDLDLNVDEVRTPSADAFAPEVFESPLTPAVLPVRSPSLECHHHHQNEKDEELPKKVLNLASIQTQDHQLLQQNRYYLQQQKRTRSLNRIRLIGRMEREKAKKQTQSCSKLPFKPILASQMPPKVRSSYFSKREDHDECTNLPTSSSLLIKESVLLNLGCPLFFPDRAKMYRTPAPSLLFPQNYKFKLQIEFEDSEKDHDSETDDVDSPRYERACSTTTSGKPQAHSGHLFSNISKDDLRSLIAGTSKNKIQ